MGRASAQCAALSVVASLAASCFLSLVQQCSLTPAHLWPCSTKRSNYSNTVLCRVRKIIITQGNFIYITNFFYSYHFKLGQNALWFVTWSKAPAKETEMCAMRGSWFCSALCFPVLCNSMVCPRDVSENRDFSKAYVEYFTGVWCGQGGKKVELEKSRETHQGWVFRV